jgi:pimeloyl-ACP methyl ester carboxylesterase
MNGGTSIVPNLDSIAEFRVLTNNFDAEYGNALSGVVEIRLKEGSDQFEGGVTTSGASFGGHVALEFAATHPDVVERLIVMGPPWDWDWSEEMEAFFTAEDAALEAGQIDEAVRLNVERWVGSADAGVKELVAEMQERAFRLQLAVETEPVEIDPPVSTRVSAIAMPVTVVMGERDVPDFIAIAHRLADELPAARLECVTRASHLPALERPEVVADLIATGS